MSYSIPLGGQINFELVRGDYTPPNGSYIQFPTVEYTAPPAAGVDFIMGATDYVPPLDSAVHFPDPEKLLRVFLEQTYDLELYGIIYGFAEQLYGNVPIAYGINEQPYLLTRVVAQFVEQIYGLKLSVILVQLYGDVPLVTAILDQYYDDGGRLRATLEQFWGDYNIVRNSNDQPYFFPALLTQVLEQRYSISANDIFKMSEQVYNISGVDYVRQFVNQPFSLLDDGSQVAVGNNQVIVTSSTGVETALSFFHINVESTSDQYCMSCEVHLASQIDYERCRILDDLTVTIGSDVFEFFIESRQRNRSHGNAQYSISGLSKTALLDSPYTEGITNEEGLTGMASAIVTTLAAGYTVNWNTVDWFIPTDTLMPSDETPLSIIRNIAAAAGAIIQTEPNGEMTIEPRYVTTLNPSTPINWYTITPAYTLSDAFDFFNTGETFEFRPGYNRYLITDSETSEQTVRFEEESISATEKLVRTYQVPWTGIFDVGHTGCSWVTLFDEGVENRLIEDEIVEFIDGAGSTSYPIYSIDGDPHWQCDNLGAVTFEEDGSLTSAIENESLLRISYYTRCQVYRVINPEDEELQLVAEEV